MLDESMVMGGAARVARRRVAIIASNFWPEQTGSSQTVSEFARYLANRGLDVCVATSMPYYPQWTIWPRYRGRVWLTEAEDGITIHRSWHYARHAPSTLTRMLHELTLSLSAFPNMVRALHGARVVYVVSPALGFAFVGLLLAWVLRVPRVLVVKDVMPDAAIELGMLRGKSSIRAFQWLARRIYAMADEIHTLGEGMRRRILSQADAAKRVLIVPDTVDGEEMTPVKPEANEFRQRFVRAGTFAVLHTGNMGKKQDLGLIVRTAARVRADESLRFYVFGDGAVKDDFLKACGNLRLGNVSQHPLQDRWLLPHMLSGADVVLVSQAAEVVDIVVPSKLITSMAAGAMIVAACAPESETARLVRTSNGGILVPAGDDAALAEVIGRIRHGELDVRGFRRRARSFALAAFNRDTVYGPIADGLVQGWEPRTLSRQLPPVGFHRRSAAREVGEIPAESCQGGIES